MVKKLYRVENGKKLSGVCMGLAEYINIDVTIIRLIWALFTIFTGFFMGIVLYIACVFTIPEEPGYIDGQYTEK